MASHTGYMIINKDSNKGGLNQNCFRYGGTFGGLDDVLNYYIKDVMGYGRAFPLSEEVWKSISNRFPITDDTQVNNLLSDKVQLINGLCKVDRYKISYIAVDYTRLFG